jgi:hypothetical protein
MAMPWSKFFWSDYAADPALRLCSFAAQGLWMRMLCIAAEHDPAGYVAVNGRGLDETAIARSTGGALEEVISLLFELESHGVYSRDRRGWIYSRRLVNDAKRRRNAAEAGKKGGNPTLRKETEKFGTLKGQDKVNLNGQANPQKPEARTLDKSNAASAAPNDDPVKQIFDLGCALLTAAGTPEKQARSLLGKWRKAAKSDGEVITALIDCRARAISEPVEWLQKRFNGAAYVSASGHEYRGSREQILREAERRNDMGTYWQIKRELADEQRAAN